MRGEDDDRSFGHLIGLADEHRAALGQGVDDVAVVHDLLADVYRRAVLVESPLHRFDSPVDAGAIAARLGKQDTLGGHGFQGTDSGGAWLNVRLSDMAQLTS